MGLISLLVCFVTGPGLGFCFEDLAASEAWDTAPLNAIPVLVTLAMVAVSVVLVHTGALIVYGRMLLRLWGGVEQASPSPWLAPLARVVGRVGPMGTGGVLVFLGWFSGWPWNA